MFNKRVGFSGLKLRQEFNKANWGRRSDSEEKRGGKGGVRIVQH